MEIMEYYCTLVHCAYVKESYDHTNDAVWLRLSVAVVSYFAFLRASFASIFCGLGVPVFCYVALRYHNVPRMAREKRVCSEFLISELYFRI